MPGKSNNAAGATSTYPSQPCAAIGIPLRSPCFPDIAKLALMSKIRTDSQELGTIPWSLFAKETAADASLVHLLQLIVHWKQIDGDDSSLRSICESIYSEEGVILCQDRVVVPLSLRRRVLQNLHAAHQGTSTMEQRARAIVYWPEMSRNIRETREGCVDCNKNAHSQATTPPHSSTPPPTPFEAVLLIFLPPGLPLPGFR